MAETKNKNFEIQNYFYLTGPLALVALFLTDVIGGINYPGYSWISQVIGDLNALNSYSVIVSMVFAIIYALLTIVSAYCVYKFYKTSKFNKKIKRGILFFVIAAVVAAIGFAAFVQTETGTYDKVKEYAQIATTEETVEPDSDDENAVAETKTVIDEEATTKNMEDLSQLLVDNPTVIAGLAASVIANILAVIALIFILIGAIKKGGKTMFAAVSIFCLVLIVYSLIAVSVMAPDYLGLNSRFANYAIVLFMTFLSAYVYVTNIEE